MDPFDPSTVRDVQLPAARSELRSEAHTKRSSPFWGFGTPLGTWRYDIKGNLLEKGDKIFQRNIGAAQNGPQGSRLDGLRAMHRDNRPPAQINLMAKNGVASALAHQDKAGFLQGAYDTRAGHLGEIRHQAAISLINILRFSRARWSSLMDQRYNRIAFRIFEIASRRVSPWDAQPGSFGTYTLYPPAGSSSRMILYFILSPLPEIFIDLLFAAVAIYNIKRLEGQTTLLRSGTRRSRVRLARQEPSTVRDVQLPAARSEIRQGSRTPAVPEALASGRSELPSARSGLRTPRALKPSVSRAEVRLARQEPSTAQDVQLFAARSELRAKDEQIQKLQEAYQKLANAKASAKEEIGDIGGLVRLNYGRFQRSFPLLNAKSLGEQRQLGSGKNLKSISLVLEKRKDGRLYYVFSYEKKDGGKGTVEHYWDEEKQELIQGVKLESEQDQQILTLREAYQKLTKAKSGEEEEIGNIAALMDFTGGQFQMSFPLPDGKNLGENRPLGSGKNLVKVSLLLEKRQDGRLYYVFSYEKKKGGKGTVEHYWDEEKQELIQGVKLESEQDQQILKLREAYKKLEKTKAGAREAIGDDSELVYLKGGQFQKSFPLPNGKNLGDNRPLGSGENLAKAFLSLEKRNDGRLYYVFSYEKKDGGKGTVEHYWDEEKQDLISASEQDQQILKLQDAYKKLEKAKAGEKEEIGDMGGLVNLKVGKFQMSFPLPNGKNLGDNRPLGSGKNLKSISLVLEKHKDGRLYYVFSYEKMKREKGSVEHYWDEVKQDFIQGMRIESEQDRQLLKLQEAYKKLEKAKAGDEEAIEDIGGLVNLEYGYLQTAFPLPNGKSLGEIRPLGSGRNLASVFLLLEKRKDNRLYYVFSYEKEEGGKGTVEHYWDERHQDLIQGVKLESEQDQQILKLQEAYKKLEKAKAGEKAEIGDIGGLVYLKRGRFQRSFPLPNGKSLGEVWPLGSGENLKRVSLLLEKRKDGRLYFVFSYEKEEGGKDTVEHYWEAVKEKLVSIGEEVDAGDAIDKYEFAEAVALLGNDPLRLLQYLRIYYPDLSPEEIDGAVAASLKGLRGEGAETEELHLGFEENLSEPEIIQDVQSTNAHSFALSGRTRPGIPFIQVAGAYTRKIVVRQDGSFSASIPLPRTGETNEFTVYAFDPESGEKGPPVLMRVDQTGQREDVEEAFLRLLALKEEKLEAIQQNPARYEFLLRSVEQSLLKHFTYDEEAGLRYLENRIGKEKSKAQKAILEAVFKKFRKIKDMSFKLKEGERPYFFQKYTAYEIQSLMAKGAKGVIIANEQGTGKTVITLMVMNGKEGVILTPNSVVSTWAEQEEQFIPQANLEMLEGTYAEREETLTNLKKPQLVTNIEFTRAMNERKAHLLSRPQGLLVVDEADYLGSKTSQQAKGTRQIQAGFKLLLTATPFKRISQIGELLQFIRPDDSRFSSARAFARAFPAEDREAMNALFLLMQEHTIRIRKQDVFETYDPHIPLEKQSARLPAKEKISPEETGKFDLHKVQMESILELFTDPESWMRKHKGQESVEDTQYYRYKEGYFSKREALRQLMNDPAYIGRPDIESPKHLEMDEIIKQKEEMDRYPEKKMLIFTRYRAQVAEYKKRYDSSYGVRTYYGDLLQNANGYKVDENGNVLYYKVDEYENPVLENGKLVETDKEHGRPVRALDYERILFQNDPDSRIMVATYDAGAVGVTFTAADVVVFDDLAQTYRDEYQAEDRAHRIDNKRKKYKVKYYWLQARYPESFLRKLPKEIREQYFSMGTFDQVQYENLRILARIFHRVMDGVGSEDELGEANQHFMSQRMPFMFSQGEAEDETPESEADEEKADASSRSEVRSESIPQEFIKRIDTEYQGAVERNPARANLGFVFYLVLSHLHQNPKLWPTKTKWGIFTTEMEEMEVASEVLRQMTNLYSDLEKPSVLPAHESLYDQIQEYERAITAGDPKLARFILDTRLHARERTQFFMKGREIKLSNGKRGDLSDWIHEVISPRSEARQVPRTLAVQGSPKPARSELRHVENVITEVKKWLAEESKELTEAEVYQLIQAAVASLLVEAQGVDTGTGTAPVTRGINLRMIVKAREIIGKELGFDPSNPSQISEDSKQQILVLDKELRLPALLDKRLVELQSTLGKLLAQGQLDLPRLMGQIRKLVRWFKPLSFPDQKDLKPDAQEILYKILDEMAHQTLSEMIQARLAAQELISGEIKEPIKAGDILLDKGTGTVYRAESAHQVARWNPLGAAKFSEVLTVDEIKNKSLSLILSPSAARSEVRTEWEGSSLSLEILDQDLRIHPLDVVESVQGVSLSETEKALVEERLRPILAKAKALGDEEMAAFLEKRDLNKQIKKADLGAEVYGVESRSGKIYLNTLLLEAAQKANNVVNHALLSDAAREDHRRFYEGVLHYLDETLIHEFQHEIDFAAGRFLSGLDNPKVRDEMERSAIIKTAAYFNGTILTDISGGKAQFAAIYRYEFSDKSIVSAAYTTKLSLLQPSENDFAKVSDNTNPKFKYYEVVLQLLKKYSRSETRRLGERQPPRTFAAASGRFFDFVKEFLGYPDANQGQVSDAFSSRDFFEADNFRFGKPHRNQFFAGFGKFQLGRLELVQKLSRIMAVPKGSLFLKGFKFGYLAFLSEAHVLSPLLVKYFLGARHIAGRNRSYDSSAAVTADNQQIPAVVRLAINQIPFFPSFKDTGGMKARLLNFFRIHPVTGNMINVFFIPLKRSDLQNRTSFPKIIGVYTIDVKPGMDFLPRANAPKLQYVSAAQKAAAFYPTNPDEYFRSGKNNSSSEQGQQDNRRSELRQGRNRADAAAEVFVRRLTGKSVSLSSLKKAAHATVLLKVEPVTRRLEAFREKLESESSSAALEILKAQTQQMIDAVRSKGAALNGGAFAYFISNDSAREEDWTTSFERALRHLSGLVEEVIVPAKLDRGAKQGISEVVKKFEGIKSSVKDLTEEPVFIGNNTHSGVVVSGVKNPQEFLNQLDPAYIPVVNVDAAQDEDPLISEFVLLAQMTIALLVADFVRDDAAKAKVLQNPALLFEQYPDLFPGYQDRVVQGEGGYLKISNSVVRAFLAEMTARAEIRKSA